MPSFMQKYRFLLIGILLIAFSTNLLAQDASDSEVYKLGDNLLPLHQTGIFSHLELGLNITDLPDTDLQNQIDNLRLSGYNASDIILQSIQFTNQDAVNSNSLWKSLSTSPGAGFLGSALVPGLSQAAGGQYWKTALYLALEATAIVLIIDGNKRGERLERRYIYNGNRDWSVVKYASWVHEYYHNVPGARAPGAPDVDIKSLLTPAGLAQYNQLGQFPSPVFDTELEWAWINLNALRQLERRSLYLTSGRPFSHDVQDFGSQQYYELMSKYFQFGPGWRDWSNNIHDVNAGLSGMSPMWLDHARLEERFNDSFRLAGNMITLLVVNHVVSAFDALFTIQLRNHRLESGMQVTNQGAEYQLIWRF